MQYRRYYLEGASYFFTVNLADRSSSLLIQEIETLRLAFKTVKENHPFDIDAIVILPDHFHMLCTLPKDDANYSKRIKLIKYYFSYHIAKTERISPSRQNDPVKHGDVKRIQNWRNSSFHRYVTEGFLDLDWGSEVKYFCRVSQTPPNLRANDELNAVTNLTKNGYNITFQRTASQKGVQNTKIADTILDGYGPLDITRTETINSTTKRIEKKDKQAKVVYVQTYFSDKDQKQIIDRVSNKPAIKNINTVKFENQTVQ